MKSRTTNRLLATTLMLALTSLIFTARSFASASPKLREMKTAPVKSSPVTSPAQSQTRPEKTQASDEELERVRTDLVNFVRAYKDAAETVSPKQAQKFNGIEEQLNSLSAKQLNIIRIGMPDFSVVGRTAQKLRNAVEQSNLQHGISTSQVNGGKFDSTQSASASQKDGLIQINSAGFPDADYPTCGSTRIDDAIIDASDTALFVAEGVRDAASRACDEVVVILGEGGNGSLVCIITDAIYLAAKGVNYGLHYCNDKIDSAEQQANYTRLGHLHTDIENSIADANANKTAIINNATTNTNNIVANDNTNKNTIVSNDNTNTATIVSNDNTNKNTIVANNNANTASIIANALANKNELRDLTLRTQIEANLAQNEGATPIALFELPSNRGGYLDLVRTIVAQTISNIQTAGASVGNAQSFFGKADAYKAAGDFKSAYDNYRKAYKAASK